MHPSQIPEKPLTVGVGHKEPAERVYFFARPDGTPFHVDAHTAWTLYARGNQIIGERNERPRYIGTSSGEIYARAVIEAHKAISEDRIEESKEILSKAIEAELEVAKTSQTPPPNFDSVDRRGQPVNIALLR